MASVALSHQRRKSSGPGLHVTEPRECCEQTNSSESVEPALIFTSALPLHSLRTLGNALNSYPQVPHLYNADNIPFHGCFEDEMQGSRKASVWDVVSAHSASAVGTELILV